MENLTKKAKEVIQYCSDTHVYKKGSVVKLSDGMMLTGNLELRYSHQDERIYLEVLTPGTMYRLLEINEDILLAFKTLFESMEEV